MASRRMEFFIGMTVVVIFLAVAVMTILFGPQKGLIHRGGKKMTIYFEKANGITNNSPVLKSGIEIGRVYKRELVDNEKSGVVHVYFELDPNMKIYSNEYAKISRSLLGDAAIEFVKNPTYQGPVKEIEAEDVIRGIPGGDITATVSNIEGDLAKAIQKVTDAAESLTKFMKNLNDFMGDPDEIQLKKERLKKIFSDLNETLLSIKGLANNMNTTVNDVVNNPEFKQNLKDSIAAVPKIVNKVDTLMENANKLSEDFRLTIERSHKTFDQVQKNLDNLDDFTSSLAEEGPEFLSSLTDSSKDIRVMVGNISDLAADLVKQMNNPETPLGMLANKQMAESLNNIVRNAEEISEKVKPVVDDARVFSNKIAHKPSLLLWGGATYKGVPSFNRSQYGFQQKTPNGGLSSRLYQGTASSNARLLSGNENSFLDSALRNSIYSHDENTDLSRTPDVTLDAESIATRYPRYTAQSKKSCLSKFTLPGWLGGGEKNSGSDMEWGSFYGSPENMRGYYQGTMPEYNGEVISTGSNSVSDGIRLPETGLPYNEVVDSMVPYNGKTTAPGQYIPSETLPGTMSLTSTMVDDGLPMTSVPSVGYAEYSPSGSMVSEPVVSSPMTSASIEGQMKKQYITPEYSIPSRYNRNRFMENKSHLVSNNINTSVGSYENPSDRKMKFSLKSAFSKVFPSKENKKPLSNHPTVIPQSMPPINMTDPNRYGYEQAMNYGSNQEGMISNNGTAVVSRGYLPKNGSSIPSGMNTGFSGQEEVLYQQAPWSNNSVNRVPMTRSAHEEKVESNSFQEELPPSVLRKRPSSNFVDDGLPMNN